jgi:hypothetical protein
MKTNKQRFDFDLILEIRIRTIEYNESEKQTTNQTKSVAKRFVVCFSDLLYSIHSFEQDDTSLRINKIVFCSLTLKPFVVCFSNSLYSLIKFMYYPLDIIQIKKANPFRIF